VIRIWSENPLLSSSQLQLTDEVHATRMATNERHTAKTGQATFILEDNLREAYSAFTTGVGWVTIEKACDLKEFLGVWQDYLMDSPGDEREKPLGYGSGIDTISHSSTFNRVLSLSLSLSPVWR
jgi:hypothetical protein